MEHLGQNLGEMELRNRDKVRASEDSGEERNPTTSERDHMADVEWRPLV